jgi:hypothetical protein
VENGQKIEVLQFLQNLGILLGLCSLRCKNFWQKISTGKVLFGGFCGVIGSTCNLHAIHTENETLLVVNPVPPKAKGVGDMGMGDVHKNFGKYFGPLVCVWRVVVLGQSILT